MSALLIAALLGRDWLPLRIQSVIKTRGGKGGELSWRQRLMQVFSRCLTVKSSFKKKNSNKIIKM